MGVSPQHETLVASAITTFTFDQEYPVVEVLNVDGAALVWFRGDGTDPVAAEDGTHVLPAAIGALKIYTRPVSVPGVGLRTQVKVVSPGTPLVSVRGLNL
jgi:hypothetical protein